jgi:hypothetical protein
MSALSGADLTRPTHPTMTTAHAAMRRGGPRVPWTTRASCERAERDRRAPGAGDPGAARRRDRERAQPVPDGTGGDDSAAGAGHAAPAVQGMGHPLGRYVTSRARLDLPPRWIREARGRGISFVVSTDAHSVSGLDNVAVGRRHGAARLAHAGRRAERPGRRRVPCRRAAVSGCQVTPPWLGPGQSRRTRGIHDTPRRFHRVHAAVLMPDGAGSGGIAVRPPIGRISLRPRRSSRAHATPIVRSGCSRRRKRTRASGTTSKACRSRYRR